MATDAATTAVSAADYYLDYKVTHPNGNASRLDAPNVDPFRDTKYDFPRDLVGYGRGSWDPKWPGGKRIAVNFVINYEEGAERSVTLGDQQSEPRLWEQSDIGPRVGYRQINTESDYDYGARVGVWRLLDLFEAHGFPVTAYAVGQALEQNPPVVAALLRGGHEIASHGYRWIDHNGLPAALEREYIVRQIKCLTELTGRAPLGWYIGRLSPLTKGLIWEVYEELRLPLLYESDAYDDDLPHWVDVPKAQAKKPKAEAEAESVGDDNDNRHPKTAGMLMIPYSYDCNDMKYHTPAGFGSASAFEDHLRTAFDTLYDEGCRGRPKMMTVGLHCRVSGKPGRFGAIKNFVEYVAGKPDVWVTTRQAIAEHWRREFPYRPK